MALSYLAAWTDSGFLLGCSHQHQTIASAVTSCIPPLSAEPKWVYS